MTCILSAKGTTPDNKLYAKISGVQYILPHTMKKDLDKFSVDDEVEFNETNGIITRIWKPKKVPAKAVPTNGNGKNDRLIAFLALHRDAVQAATFCHTPDTQDFGAFMDQINERADLDLERAMQKYGMV